MSEGNPLKRLYYFFEDSYYALLDKVNKVIPVYKLVDPIDRVFPSFLLFIALLFLILWLALSWVAPFAPQEGILSVQFVEKETGRPAGNLQLWVTINEGAESFKVGTDSNGSFDLNYPLNTRFDFNVSADGFKPLTKSFTLTKKKQFLQVELESAVPVVEWNERTVSFVDKFGSFVSDQINVTFNCSNIDAESIRILPRELSNSGYVIEKTDIKYPSNCGKILVSVEDSANYLPVLDRELVDGTVVLEMKSVPADKGSVTVIVYDKETRNAINNKRFDLLVFACDGNDKNSCATDKFTSKTTSLSGQKTFELPTGYYYIKASDWDFSPEYYPAESGVKEVRAGGSAVQFSIFVERMTAGDENNITVRVFDANSNQPLNANISLYRKSDYLLAAEKRDANFASFALTEDIDYEVWVRREGFISHKGEETLNLGDDLNVSLVALNPETTGTVEVTVGKAEGGGAPYGTMVYLYYASTEGNLAHKKAYEPKPLSVMGKAKFDLVEPGHFYAVAKHDFYEGQSEEKEVKATETTSFHVFMEKFNGSVKLNVTDLGSGQAIGSFDANFFNASDGSPIDPSDMNLESNTFVFPAGKTLYAIISAPGFVTHTTSAITVQKGITLEWNVFLEKSSAVDGPKLVFVGVTDAGGTPLKDDEPIELGKEYLLHFNALFDSSQEFTFASLHFRAGEDAGDMSNDPLFIESISTTGSFDENVSVRKSTHFSGSYSVENFKRDYVDSVVSAGKSKWLELEFHNMEALHGTYSFGVTLGVEVASSVYDLSGLQVKFKALVINEEQPVTAKSFYPNQDPSSFGEINVDKFLYADTITQKLSLCKTQGDFCFTDSIDALSNEPRCAVTDVEGSRSIIRAGCKYNWFFMLINSKSDLLSPNPVLTLSNKLLSGTKTKDANTVEFVSFGFNSASTSSSENPFRSGFPKDSLITSSTAFNPIELGVGSGLWAELEQGTSSLFSSSRMLSIRGNTPTTLVVVPSEVTPFGEEKEIKVKVLGEFGVGLPGKEVEVFIQVGPGEGTATTKTGERVKGYGNSIYTDSNGVAVFSLVPGNQMPGKVFWFKVFDEKESDDVWASLEVAETGTVLIQDLETKQEITNENPLWVTFLHKLHKQKSKKILLTNVSTDVEKGGSIEETIVGIDATFGENAELLRTEAIRSDLNKYLESSIASNGTTLDFNVVLDESVLAQLTENTFVEGTIDLNVQIGATETRSFKAPFLVSLILKSSEFVRAEDMEGNEITEQNPLKYSILVEDMNSAPGSFYLKNISSPKKEISIVSFDLQANGGDLKKEAMIEGLDSLKGALIKAGSGTETNFKVILSDEGKEQPQTKAKNYYLIVPIKVDFSGTKKPDMVLVPFAVEFVTKKDFLDLVLVPVNYFEFALGEEEPKHSDSLELSVSSKKLSFTSFSAAVSSLEIGKPSEQELFESTFPQDAVTVLPGEEKRITLTSNLSDKGKDLNLSEFSRKFEGKLTILVTIIGKIVPVELDVKAFIKKDLLVIQEEGFKVEICDLGLGALNASGPDFDVSFAITGCGIGRKRKCKTGPEAAPRVLLKWKWSVFGDIDADSFGKCDIKRKGAVFCDATQFSMELLSKLNKIKNGENDSNLTDFNALMMADLFSQDFVNDFLSYSSGAFMETPPYFLGSAYLRKNFENIAFNDSELQTNYAGLYNVTISFASGAKEKFLNGEDLSNEDISVDFKFLKKPEFAVGHTSVFYYLPFDGLVGQNTEGQFDREGYGLRYGFQPGTGKIFLTAEQGEAIELTQSTGTTGAMLVLDRPYALIESVSPKNNGKLLSLSWEGSGRTLVFNPSYATPILLDMNLNLGKVKESKASAYYSLKKEDGSQVSGLGEEFISWNGLKGECLDFSGIETEGEEYFDQPASTEDAGIIPDFYSNARKLVWENAVLGGKLGLTSVVYVPTWDGQKYRLQLHVPSKENDNHFEFVKFFTPGKVSDPSSDNSVLMNGVSGMNKNYAPSGNAVNSIKDVLGLVKEGMVCVENIGNTSAFYWNDANILEQGKKSSTVFETALVNATKTESCITEPQ